VPDQAIGTVIDGIAPLGGFLDIAHGVQDHVARGRPSRVVEVFAPALRGGTEHTLPLLLGRLVDHQVVLAGA